LSRIRKYPLSADELARRAARYNDHFFSQLGVDRDVAERLWRTVSEPLGLPTAPHSSIHRLAFAALRVGGFRPRHILELGTAAGHTTRYLSDLFPEATIVTVELPPDDPLFTKIHPEGDRALVNGLQRPNIVSLRMNTLFIAKENLPAFDLIWIDAGHRFPEVAWDHFLCFHNLAPGGWLFSDDVRFPDNRMARKEPGSLAAWSVIEYFNMRQSEQFRFLLKREDLKSFLLDPKYVAYLCKRP
jgi:predicted O-methyltransferase YrrM